MAAMDEETMTLALASSDASEQIRALRHAARAPGRLGLDRLAPLTGSADPAVRVAAVWAIDGLRAREAVPLLLGLFRDESFDVRSAAGWALVHLGGEVEPAVEAVLRGSALREARQMALLVLERLGLRSPPPEPPARPRSREAPVDPLAARILALAHDINNKLTVVLCTAQWLRDEMGESASLKDREELVDHLIAACTRVAELIARFVSVALVMDQAAPSPPHSVGDEHLSFRHLSDALHESHNVRTLLTRASARDFQLN